MSPPPVKSLPTYPSSELIISLCFHDSMLELLLKQLTLSLVSLFYNDQSPLANHELCGARGCALFVVITLAPITVAAYSRCQLLSVE